MNNTFVTSKRGSMTPQRRARIFAARGGVCGNKDRGGEDWGCGRKLRPPADSWTIEHDPALENGGEDVDEQCYVVCEWCKKPKDADDHAEAARNRRRFTNHVVPREYRKAKWGSR
jgi:hypothetical protein